jgi:hypothetical protein
VLNAPPLRQGGGGQVLPLKAKNIILICYAIGIKGASLIL